MLNLVLPSSFFLNDLTNLRAMSCADTAAAMTVMTFFVPFAESAFGCEPAHGASYMMDVTGATAAGAMIEMPGETA